METDVIVALIGFAGTIGAVIVESRSIKRDLASLGKRVDGLDRKVDNLNIKLSGQISDLDNKLSARVDNLDTKLSGRIENLSMQMQVTGLAHGIARPDEMTTHAPRPS